jgi:excisionase family DNA binding protein
METRFDSVISIVRETPTAQLPALIGVLATAQAEAWGRLTAPSNERRDDGDEVLTASEVGRALGRSEEGVRRLMRSGRIPTVRVGKRSVRVRRGALRDFIRRSEKQAVVVG